MSAQHDAARAGDTDPDWDDPHDILPDEFKRRYSAADSAREALAMAAAAKVTDTAGSRRCGACLSVQLRQKTGREQTHKKAGGYRCVSCGAHQSDVLPPLAEARQQADHAPGTDRERERPRCRACLSTDLYPVPERTAAVDARWACLDCGERFEDALPSYNATVRGEATSAERERIGELLRGGSDE